MSISIKRLTLEGASPGSKQKRQYCLHLSGDCRSTRHIIARRRSGSSLQVARGRRIAGIRLMERQGRGCTHIKDVADARGWRRRVWSLGQKRSSSGRSQNQDQQLRMRLRQKAKDLWRWLVAYFEDEHTLHEVCLDAPAGVCPWRWRATK